MNAPLLRLALLPALLLALPAEAQDWQTADVFEGTYKSRGEAVAVDAAGNVFVTGPFGGAITFGSFTLTSVGSDDVFLVKYSPGGEVLWARSAGGQYYDQSYDVEVDAAGNAYITGQFMGWATFGSVTITSSGQFNRNVFAAKYAPNGNVIWAQGGGGDDWDYGYGIAVSENGDAYVVGHFWEVATFGSFTLTSVGQYDVFLVKYSADGDVLWAQSGGGAQWDEGYGVAVDAADNAYITGRFYSAAGGTTFGPFTLISTGDSDVFVVKYAPSGEVLWAESDGTNHRDYSYGMAVDTIGNAYVTGSSQISQGDAFLMKYSPEGEVLWEWRGGGAYEDSGYDVAVDAAGNAYVIGSFGGRDWGNQGGGSVTFGPFTLTSAGRADFFLVKYSADGDVLAARSGGGTQDDYGYGVAVDAAGNAYVTGELRWAGVIGSCPFDIGQQGAGFLARTGEPVPVSVNAAPVGAPVVIPAAGGHFDFTATLSNPSAQPQTYEAWTAVTGAADSDLVLGPQTVTVPPGGTVSKTLRQAVPAFAPAGTYTYHVRVGDASCATPASGSFTFTKAAGERIAEAGSIDGWSASGWDENASPEAPAALAALPGGYALSEAHPNPSGGRTQLTLELVEAQQVTAAVYDGLGRRVAVLLDGAAEAGAHALVFDGSSLPAGVYLVRVVGETFATSQRVTLVR